MSTTTSLSGPLLLLVLLLDGPTCWSPLPPSAAPSPAAQHPSRALSAAPPCCVVAAVLRSGCDARSSAPAPRPGKCRGTSSSSAVQLLCLWWLLRSPSISIANMHARVALVVPLSMWARRRAEPRRHHPVGPPWRRRAWWGPRPRRRRKVWLLVRHRRHPGVRRGVRAVGRRRGAPLRRRGGGGRVRVGVDVDGAVRWRRRVGVRWGWRRARGRVVPGRHDVAVPHARPSRWCVLLLLLVLVLVVLRRRCSPPLGRAGLLVVVLLLLRRRRSTFLQPQHVGQLPGCGVRLQRGAWAPPRPPAPPSPSC